MSEDKTTSKNYNYPGMEDQFIYDENSSGKSSFLKQDSELFNDDDNIPGRLIRVKRFESGSQENWKVYVDDKEFLLLKGSRFSLKEREFLRTTAGVLFVINGIKSGWKSVSEFKRNMKVDE